MALGLHNFRGVCFWRMYVEVNGDRSLKNTEKSVNTYSSCKSRLTIWIYKKKYHNYNIYIKF
jgi:hypothetical protein